MSQILLAGAFHIAVQSCCCPLALLPLTTYFWASLGTKLPKTCHQYWLGEDRYLFGLEHDTPNLKQSHNENYYFVDCIFCWEMFVIHQNFLVLFWNSAVYMFCAYMFVFFPLFAFTFNVFQFVGSRPLFHFGNTAFSSDPIFQRLFRPSFFWNHEWNN